MKIFKTLLKIAAVAIPAAAAYVWVKRKELVFWKDELADGLLDSEDPLFIAEGQEAYKDPAEAQPAVEAEPAIEEAPTEEAPVQEEPEEPEEPEPEAEGSGEEPEVAREESADEDVLAEAQGIEDDEDIRFVDLSDNEGEIIEIKEDTEDSFKKEELPSEEPVEDKPVKKTDEKPSEALEPEETEAAELMSKIDSFPIFNSDESRN